MVPLLVSVNFERLNMTVARDNCLRVDSVHANSLLDAAGIKVDDLIIAVNNSGFKDLAGFAVLAKQARRVTLEYIPAAAYKRLQADAANPLIVRV